MAAEDAYGTVLNEYTHRHGVDSHVPEHPWAIYLAGTDRRFRLLAFDLDAKTTDTAQTADRDARTLAELLTAAGLPPVICQSGPSGGRHVWSALSESVDAETVATLARLAHHLCPTLDLAPLTNPVTGCVRPPGAPHRAGGTSTVLSGDLNTLLNPTATASQVRELVEHLAQLITDTGPAGRSNPDRALPIDGHGHPYLPGPRRELPAASKTALYEDAAAGDASNALWRVLIGAASARWRHADIAALAAHSPGLEHLRTTRHSTGTATHRLPRTPGDQALVLARQWAKAVAHVAATPRRTGDDPTFDTRAATITTHIRDVQTRADAAQGRWTHRGGPADRRVLDALSILALRALTDELEADTRRLALLAGIGRETARTALLRLAADSWITKTRDAEGPRAAHWKINPSPSIHRAETFGRSQGDPRPVGAGAPERTLLLDELTTRLHSSAHDIFTPGPGLGHLAGNLYARTSHHPTDTISLASTTGLPVPYTHRLLNRLSSAGLLIYGPDGWHRPALDARNTAAERLEVTGRLIDRAARYQLERELWAWWQAELTWMRSPRRTAPHHRPGLGQVALLPEHTHKIYIAHPRRADGRADFRTARCILSTGTTPIRPLQHPTDRPATTTKSQRFQRAA